MFLNGKKAASVLYGMDFLLFLSHFCLLLLTLYNIKSGNKSPSLILAYDFFF